MYDKTIAMLDCQRPPLLLKDFQPEAFGHALLFAVRNYVDAKAIMVDGTRDPTKVAAAISTGDVRFLTLNGEFIRPVIHREDAG